MNRKRFNQKKATNGKKPVNGDRELATLAETCQLFRVCDRTIIRRVKSGELPGLKQGGQWRFPWAKIRELAGVG